MKKSIGYVRISTKDQSNFSLSGQEKSIRDFAARKDIMVHALFVDNGKSAKSFDRPDWKKLESFIKEHHRNIDYLVVAKYDRFSRNAAEGLQKIELLERRYNIIILSVYEEMFIDYDSPYFFKQRADMLVNAEFELHVIRDRTKFGIHQALSSGRFITTAPWGYKNARDEKNKPVILPIPERVPIIQKIYSLYMAGFGFKEIEKEVKKIGFSMTSHNAVKSVLSNCVYGGLIYVPSYRKDATKYVKGIHTPIIEEHIWWEVQRRMGNAPQLKNIFNDEVPLRGEIHCFCGKPLTAGNSKGRSKYYWYYKCGDHVKINLSASTLHTQFDEILSEMSLSQLHVSYLKEKAAQVMADLLKEKSNSIDQLKKELSITQKNLESVEEKYIIGTLAAESYQKWYSRYSTEISSIRYRISELETAHAGKWKIFNDNISALGDIKELYHSANIQQKKMFLRLGFNYGLRYQEGSYRTTYLHPLLSINSLILKEKKLLFIDKPREILHENRGSIPPQSLIEPALPLMQLIADIKTA